MLKSNGFTIYGILTSSKILKFKKRDLMTKDIFNFMAYRLIKSTEEDLWSISRNNDLINDDDIIKFWEYASQSHFDIIHETNHNKYKWSFRKGTVIVDGNENKLLNTYVLGKSLLEKDAIVVDDNGFHEDRTYSQPAPAETMEILVYWKRHIVLIENRSKMVTGETWLKHYNEIMIKVAEEMDYKKVPQLENIPIVKSIISIFNKLKKVTRIKVHLELPNPDMSRLSKSLKEKLEEDSIQELKQDMFNPNGISKKEEGLPLSSLALAELGYKKGSVFIEGIGENGFEKYETGNKTAKGSLHGFKNFIKGLGINTKTKEGTNIIAAIEQELERIVPLDD
jgi:hypothetical protein